MCHLAWLIRDNRHMLHFVPNATCSNGVKFKVQLKEQPPK